VALTAPLDDPVQALTPILPSFFPFSNAISPFNVADNHSTAPVDGSVPAEVVKNVLFSRRFRMLTPHTILKSFHQQKLPLSSQSDLFAPSEERDQSLPGVLGLRHVAGKPICLVSNPSIQVRLLPHPALTFRGSSSRMVG
jgi:hypothetical protein